MTAGPANAVAPDPPAAIKTVHWSARADFLGGTATGVRILGDGLALEPTSRLREKYADPHGDGVARDYRVGSWTSPVIPLGFLGDEAIASWNATTPTGTFVRTNFRGQHADGTWTKWYTMGIWTSGSDYPAGDIHRTSVDGQNDTDAAIYTDTFSVRSGREITDYQVRVTLAQPIKGHGRAQGKTPSLDSLTVMANELLPSQTGPTSAFTLGRAVELAVPPYAQNLHIGEYPEYGGGGEVWCSPTSTSMVQYYWGQAYAVPDSELVDIVTNAGDPQVAYAAQRTWDYTYEGSGNWPFNTAYAHQFGLDGFVTRLRSLAEAERFIEAGIPLVTSQSWDLAEMPEAGYESNGHLMVLIGFTAEGDPILNDPARSRNDQVRSVYQRENFEKVWLESSKGVVYVMYPPGTPLPAHVAGATQNW